MLRGILFFVFVLSFPTSSLGQYPLAQEDSLQIVQTLDAQQKAWNSGDIDRFMDGYWKSEKLVFAGASGPTYGWEATRARYLKNYPNITVMGRLQFQILDVQQHSPTTIQLIGKFELFRTIGDARGYFTLHWRKFDSRWLIVSDHTSASPNE